MLNPYMYLVRLDGGSLQKKWAVVWSFYVEKVPFWVSKNDQKPRFSNPGPNVHRNRSGGGRSGPVVWCGTEASLFFGFSIFTDEKVVFWWWAPTV